MKQSTIGIILVFAGAAIAAAGILTFNSEMDKLFFFAVIFLFVSRDIGIGFLLAIFMVPDGNLMLVWAGVAACVIGGIVLVAD